MREPINKVKNFNQFINENTSNDIEGLVLRLIELKKKMDDIIHKNGCEESYDFITLKSGGKTTIHDELIRKDKEYENLSNECNELHTQIYKYYTKKLTDTYNNFGEEETKKLFYEIQKKSNEQDVVSLGVIVFDLTSFTSNLLKK